MNKIKLSHIVFSLALIAALAATSIPTAPAYALSNSSAHVVVAEKQAAALGNNIVCKSVTYWRNGHRVVVRVCHKVTKPES